MLRPGLIQDMWV